jgi:toxin-antitoxin system PIN domain toxin
MVSLLDVNLLVALAWTNHVHHKAALAWFLRNQTLGWATCPLTQSGFVRVSSNPKAMPDARSPQVAIGLLKRIVSLPNHQFWHDDVSLADSNQLALSRLTGYRQVTDAHLVTLALNRGGRLATLDRRVQSLVPPASAEAVCLVLPD